MKLCLSWTKKAVLGAFSATIPVKLEKLLRKYMSKPEFIVIDNPAIIANDSKMI